MIHHSNALRQGMIFIFLQNSFAASGGGRCFAPAGAGRGCTFPAREKYQKLAQGGYDHLENHLIFLFSYATI